MIVLYKILIAAKLEVVTEQLVANLGIDHDVHICYTGTNALDILNAIRPEILIVDLMLPHMDGLTLLNSSIYKPPVILGLTTYLGREIERIAETSGIGCLMLLPTSINAIRSNLDSLINERLQNIIPSQDT